MAAECQLHQVDEGVFVIEGRLDFQTVPALLRASAQPFAAATDLTIDLQGVSATNSAGLALVVEWMRQAKQQGKGFQLRNFPSQLKQIAEISDLYELLPIIH